MEGNKVIAIDAGDSWRRMSVGGREFEVEIWETSDLLAEIDAKHRNDPASCVCGHQWVLSDDEYSDPAKKMICPACGSMNSDENPARLRPSQLFLDDVAELLRVRFEVEKIGRRAAWRFYSAIVDACRDEKKEAT